MAPAVPLAEGKRKANPFAKPSDKTNGAAPGAAAPLAKGNPFLTPTDKARLARPAEVAANGSAGKPPVSPAPRPAAARAAGAAAAAAPAAAWEPHTEVGREAKAVVERASAAGGAAAPAALATDLQVLRGARCRCMRDAALRYALLCAAAWSSSACL